MDVKIRITNTLIKNTELPSGTQPPTTKLTPSRPISITFVNPLPITSMTVKSYCRFEHD